MFSDTASALYGHMYGDIALLELLIFFKSL